MIEWVKLAYFIAISIPVGIAVYWVILLIFGILFIGSSFICEIGEIAHKRGIQKIKNYFKKYE